MDYILEFQSLNIIRNYLLNENGQIMSFVSPLGVEFEITADYNLSCRHCYNDLYVGKKNNELTDAEWIEVAKEFKEIVILALTISGGKLLLKEELVRKIINVFKVDNNTSISIITNG